MMVSVGYFHSEALDKLHVLALLDEVVFEEVGVEIDTDSTPLAPILLYLTTLGVIFFCLRGSGASTVSCSSPTVKQPMLPSFAAI